jgi:hypothetical protein
VIDWLCKCSGIESLEIPQLLLYKPKSEYIRPDLPSAIKSEGTTLDLRLLDGHLDDPNTKSPVLMSICKSLSKPPQVVCDPQLLLGGHGFGKTKTLFDILKINYGLFLDCGGKTEEDISNTFNHIAQLVAQQVTQLFHGVACLQVQCSDLCCYVTLNSQ